MVYAASMDSAKPSLYTPLANPPSFNDSSSNSTLLLLLLRPAPASASGSGSPVVCNLDDTPTPSSLLRNASSQTSYDLAPVEVAVLGIVFGLFWLVSVLGNALVCLVIHRSRRTQSTTNYFVVSMACADLLLSLGCGPFILLQVSMGHWPLSAAACKVVRYLQHLCPGVQVYVLLSICVDRFYTIVYPLSFKVSREKAKRMILASWLFDAAFVSPCLFFYGSANGGGDDGTTRGHCDFFLPESWDGIAYGVAHLLFGFLVPTVLIMSFYQKVVRYIWRIGADGRTVRRTMNIVPRTKVKTIKMFLMLNLVFLFTWTPFYVAQLWHPRERPNGDGDAGAGASTGSTREGALFFSVVVWISLSSTASKPTLYSVYNANFRRGMRETFCMSSMKCYRSNAYTITASSRMAKKNYVGVVDMPAAVHPAAKTTLVKDSVYDTFDREAKEKKLAWPISANPPNTFV
ncbi:probable G-protein coupled receptor 19 [Engraulis encrasicolus]|uniref:probable G-protein coupled receptor 19 n=1 Tax=Engraulis encrasicolus TaxID=184585 RepID=UPI002FD2FBB2